MISGSQDSYRNIKTSPYSIWSDPPPQQHSLRKSVLKKNENNADLAKETTTVQKDLLAREIVKRKIAPVLRNQMSVA